MKLHELMENVQQRIPTRFFHETDYTYAIKILQSGGIKPLWDTHPENKQAYLDMCAAEGEEPDASGNETYATTFTHAPHGHTYFGGQHAVNTLAMFLIDASKLPQYPNEIEFYPDLEAGLAVINGNIPVSSFAGMFIEQPEKPDVAFDQLVAVCKTKNIPVEIGDSAARGRAITRFRG